jgi:hypothetical protein
MRAKRPHPSAWYRCPVTEQPVLLGRQGVRLRTAMVLAPPADTNPQLRRLVTPEYYQWLSAHAVGKVFGVGCVVGRGLLTRRWWPYLVAAAPGSYTPDQVVVNRPLRRAAPSRL